MRILAGTQTAYATQAAAIPHANGSVAQIGGKPARFSLIKGQPTVIALKYPTGKRVSSRFGADQMMYTLTDGRVGYFPLKVAAEIDSLRLAAGEPFGICHHGGAEWSIERVHTSTRPANEGAASQAGAAVEERSSAATVGSAFRNSAPAAGKLNGAGEEIPAIMRRCYTAAIEIPLEAVKTAHAKGLLLTPSFEDVRAIAATRCITETGGRR
jgi:hypothetical protein